jgi:hypothetical protein
MYTLSYPSGILRLDGVVIPTVDGDPGYEAYKDWLAAGNGPEPVPDPPAPPPTATVSQLEAAYAQLGLTEATQDQLVFDVFPLAVTL